MHNPRLWTLIVLVVALPAFGCFPIAATNPGTNPLTATEVEDVIKCQETIKEKGRSFVNKKLRNLERCADQVLDVLVKYENGLISEERAEEKFGQAGRRCDAFHAEVRRSSGRMIDAIVAACEPVEEIILTGDVLDKGDPLAFKAAFGGGGDVEELAGFICGLKEVMVDLMISFQVPRVNDEAFAEALGFESTEELLLSSLEAATDERCIYEPFLFLLDEL